MPWKPLEKIPVSPEVESRSWHVVRPRGRVGALHRQTPWLVHRLLYQLSSYSSNFQIEGTVSLLAALSSTLHSLGRGFPAFSKWHDHWTLTAAPLTTAVHLTTDLLASCASVVGQKDQSKHVEHLTGCTLSGTN